MLRKRTSSRRQFLQQLGMTAVTYPALSFAIPEVRQNSVLFGFSLYGMRTLAVGEALQICSEIGYDGVELVCMPGWPSAPEGLSAAARITLRGQLAMRKLTVSGLMENLSPLDDEQIHRTHVERLKRACELAQDLASPNPPVIETVLGGKPTDWERVRQQMVERLADWAKVAEGQKIVVALKPHVSGALHTPEDAMWLMEQLKSPWLQLAYDYSHFELQNIALAKSLELMLPRTKFIHVKDTSGDSTAFQFLLPGDGRTDYAEYFHELKAAAYRGPLIVEVSGQLHTRSGYDPIAAAKHSYSKLAPILAQAGLRAMEKP